jgi:hypothetical protein
MTTPIVKNTTAYDNWGAHQNEIAKLKAEELIADYNNGYVVVSYRTNNTKEVYTYFMMKVWHILSGSGIFMDHEIRKRGDKLEIFIEMSPQSPENIPFHF